ncbi:MAG: 3-deoxy-7-phosphoheptulonate synthase [Gemmatimonadetes bacterium]|nr:3-deoxy-7-phosphoheptulonate synthase [Gemmatimonadota bacterium]
MIVVMKADAAEADVEAACAHVRALGLVPHVSRGLQRTVIGVIGAAGERPQIHSLEGFRSVERLTEVSRPYKLVAREAHPEGSLVAVGGVEVGGREIALMAGPCAVESRDQIERAAEAVAAAGGRILRGGLFKPRTSPYSFAGLGERGLEFLRRAADRHGLAVVTEVLTPEQVPLVEAFADLLQVGARNMQNYALLEAVGRASRPVLLKRGLAARLEELLLAAERIALAGNPNVILCERGIRTYETATRNTLDVTAVPALKELSHLPVVVDPSHATGRRSLVGAAACAAVAAGADGLLIEVHPDPARALSDGAQSLDFSELAALVPRLVAHAVVEGRTLAPDRSRLDAATWLR